MKAILSDLGTFMIGAAALLTALCNMYKLYKKETAKNAKPDQSKEPPWWKRLGVVGWLALIRAVLMTVGVFWALHTLFALSRVETPLTTGAAATMAACLAVILITLAPDR